MLWCPWAGYAVIKSSANVYVVVMIVLYNQLVVWVVIFSAAA